MPAELRSCLAIDNDPGTRHPLDATGFLSEERLAVLLEALVQAGSPEWMVAYWDGWAGIEPTLRERYGGRLFPIRLPLRDYLAVLTNLEDVITVRGARAEPPFIGPSLLAANDRSVLAVADVDWPRTYVGFCSTAMRTAVGRALERQGVGVEPCDTSSPLPAS
jgi:hypothetical protein